MVPRSAAEGQEVNSRKADEAFAEHTSQVLAPDSTWRNPNSINSLGSGIGATYPDSRWA